MGKDNITNVRLIKRLKAFSVEIADEMKRDGRGPESIKEYVTERMDELADILKTRTGDREVSEKQILIIVYQYVDMFLRMR